MTDDPRQESFCDGLSEEIITTLSKIPKLFVIARNSVFTRKPLYKNLIKSSNWEKNECSAKIFLDKL
jgi:TolB-like protein